MIRWGADAFKVRLSLSVRQHIFDINTILTSQAPCDNQPGYCRSQHWNSSQDQDCSPDTRMKIRCARLQSLVTLIVSLCCVRSAMLFHPDMVFTLWEDLLWTRLLWWWLRKLSSSLGWSVLLISLSASNFLCMKRHLSPIPQSQSSFSFSNMSPVTTHSADWLGNRKYLQTIKKCHNCKTSSFRST